MRRTEQALGRLPDSEFPFVALMRGEAYVVDRIRLADGRKRITFTPWVA